MMKARALLAAALLAWAGGVAAADPENDLRASIQREVREAWNRGDYAALDRMADGYASTGARTLSGKWKLVVYSQALSGQMQIAWPRDRRIQDPSRAASDFMPPDPAYYAQADAAWTDVERRTAAWLAARPDSPHAVVARGRCLLNRAWFHRGQEWSKFVPPPAWERMRRFESEARAWLQANRDARLRDPEWFSEMYLLAEDQDWPLAERIALNDDFHRVGRDYPDALQMIFERLLPRWGGSTVMMDRYAREVTEETRAQDGGAMYARLYWNAGRHYRRTLFTEGGADWPTMRAGFRDMVRQYPDPRNLNAMASFACMAGDFDTMTEVLRQLGDQVQGALWDSFMPYEECLTLRNQARRK